MNLKRGLFRLWIGLCVLWVGGSFLIYNPFKQFSPFDEHQIEFPSWLEREKMQAALVDVIVKEREKKPGPWIGYQGKPEAWAPHIMGNYEPRTVWNVIAHWSEIALLPPLAALFAAWLTKGRKPKN